MAPESPNRHRQNPSTARADAAEIAFGDYDFGPRRPHSATPWKKSGNDRLTRHVKIETAEGPVIELFFSVDFHPDSITPAAVYAVAWEPDMVEPKRAEPDNGRRGWPSR